MENLKIGIRPVVFLLASFGKFTPKNMNKKLDLKIILVFHHGKSYLANVNIKLTR